MAKYAPPGTEGSVVSFKPRYDHFIGGEYVAPAKGQYFENPTPVTGRDLHRGRPRHGRRHREGARRRARRRAGLGQDLGRRARQHPQQDGRPHRGQPRVDRDRRDLGERQGRAARRSPPTSRSRSTTCATSPVPCAPRRARSRRSTRTRSPTTSTSRWVSSGRSSRGTSRSSWRSGSSPRALAAGNAIVLKPAEQTPASIHVLNELVGRPAAAGRAQHRQRLRRRGGQAAGVEQAHPQDRVHR